MVNWRGGDENKVQLMAQLVPISRSTSNWKATNLGLISSQKFARNKNKSLFRCALHKKD